MDRAVHRWLHALTLVVALTAGAAPVAAMPIERAAAVQVQEVGGARSDRTTTAIALTPIIIAVRIVAPRAIAPTERRVLVPDRYLLFCALLR